MNYFNILADNNISLYPEPQQVRGTLYDNHHRWRKKQLYIADNKLGKHCSIRAQNAAIENVNYM